MTATATKDGRPAQLREGRTVDWQPVRDAYITRSPTPSYTELAAEFGVSLSGVSKMAGEELWPELRAKRMELKLRESGANELLLEAIKDEGQLLQRSRQTAENAVIAANLIIEAVTANTDGVKDSSRATTLNNVCFALANLGRFIESIGIVGIAGRVKNAKNQGETPSGQPWEKGMLQQINVTVKNIQAEGERLAKQAGSSTDVDVG